MNKLLGNEEEKIIIDAINNARKTLEKLIRVQKLKSRFDLKEHYSRLDSSFQNCLSKNELNTENADLFIFIRPWSVVGDEPLDFATSEIFYHLDNNINSRPLIGGVIYGSKFGNGGRNLEDKDSKYQAASTIFLHEFTHILGFNKTIFQRKNLISHKEIKNRMNNNNYDKYFFIGDNALRIAKLYFNYSEMTGIELDIKNGDEIRHNGNAVHWNERILLGDYMIPELYSIEQAISEITLAALADLKYYKVNYFTGGLMRFGKHKGKNFLEKDCVEEAVSEMSVRIKSRFPNEFCSNVYEKGETFGTCSSGRHSMAFCLNSESYSNIKKKGDYYYIRSDFKYGDNILNGFSMKNIIEYCPFSMSNFIKDDTIYDYEGYCKFGGGRYGYNLNFMNKEPYSKIQEFLFENYSENSFCAFSSVINTNKVNPEKIKGILRPTCYKMLCSKKSLTIKIDEKYILCPRKGGPIKIDITGGYSGYLICPDYNLICTGTEMCNNLFDCAEKGSLYKNSTFYYDYPYYPLNNISSEIQDRNEDSLKDLIIKDELFELGDDGECPKYCQQCKAHKQCEICEPKHPYYVGVSENDENAIICNDNDTVPFPDKGYYQKITDNGEYYYKCIDNCLSCSDAISCNKCIPTHYINNTTGKCTERIPGCIEYDPVKHNFPSDNGGAKSYNECLSCNTTAKYYCFDMHREKCDYRPSLDIIYYGDMEDKENSCIQKCDERFMNCRTCNRTRCKECNQTYHYINKYGNCLKEIDHCKIHQLDVNYSSCAVCNDTQSYYCINDIRDKCENIQDITSYYKMSDNDDACFQKCEVTYTDLCLKCDYKGCTQCKDGYFIYNGSCYKNMTGCINNTRNNNITECDKCDESKNFYCINKTRTQCYNQTEGANIDISPYYLFANISYRCYGLCGARIPNCTECNSTNCFNCTYPNTVNRRKTFCAMPPQYFREDTKCQLNNKDLDTINKDEGSDKLEELVSEYLKDLDHINKVEHFVGKDFLMTLFINSDCTEVLLQKGYYWIDTRELGNSLIISIEDKFGIITYHLLGAYINHNYRSYLHFYDLTGDDIDLNTYCKDCIGKIYYMTHDLYTILKEVIGGSFAELVIEQELNIFDENNDIYTDSCTNLTLYEIDIPINIRKTYLLLDEYIDPLMCRDIDCELIEYNLTKRTATCQCKLQNSFAYLFEENDIKYTLSTIREKAKGISEAAKAISCMKKGLKYSNFKNNDAAILILVFFIIQFLCYIAYGCFGKPLANISNLPSIHTLANPPKLEDNSRIYLFADWNTNLSNITKKQEEPIDEQEKVIQPRDDSGDQIMEEEKSFNNDFFSDISIDTNAGGLFPDKRTNRSLRALEKSKRVLILLGNKAKKTKKKVSIEHSLNQDEAVSDSDELPLSKRRKIDNSNFWKNYWLFLSIKQHIINYFSDLTCCEITISYIPLELRFVRSIFLFILSIIITILWLDQKYFEKKWEHFNDKYSLSTTFERDFEISLGERIGYALGTNFGYVIVNLIFLIVADFITGIIFFNLRSDVEKILDKGKMSKMQDYILKVRRNYNIFYAANFILIIIFFLSLCGFGVAYPGGVVDCLTVALFSVFFFEIVPFVWSLILAALRYYGYKKKKQNMIKFSEYFLY